ELAGLEVVDGGLGAGAVHAEVVGVEDEDLAARGEAEAFEEGLRGVLGGRGERRGPDGRQGQTEPGYGYARAGHETSLMLAGGWIFRRGRLGRLPRSRAAAPRLDGRVDCATGVPEVQGRRVGWRGTTKAPRA